MMRAMRNIVRDGNGDVSTTHITLEMKAINSRQFLDTSKPDKFKPEKLAVANVGRTTPANLRLRRNQRGIHLGLALL